jgi:ATP adenylyltransferase
MSDARLVFEPGTLRAAVVSCTERALACGALEPVATDQELIEDGGVAFVVRRVSSLARKEAERARRVAAGEAPGPRPADPFASPEPALVVGALSDAHLGVLNKFPVLAHHLLVVTRAFAPQEVLLDAGDLAVLAACLAEIDGLGFYNGGVVAGASQPHKHLQLVPLPLGDAGAPVPIEPRLPADAPLDRVIEAPSLPFAHAFARLEPGLFADPAAAGRRLHERFEEARAALGLAGIPSPEGLLQSAPYNLLVTRRWLLLVPRTHERFQTVPMNALGFAGSLFVRDAAERALLRRVGPLAALCAVARPRR